MKATEQNFPVVLSIVSKVAVSVYVWMKSQVLIQQCISQYIKQHHNTVLTAFIRNVTLQGFFTDSKVKNHLVEHHKQDNRKALFSR